MKGVLIRAAERETSSDALVHALLHKFGLHFRHDIVHNPAKDMCGWRGTGTVSHNPVLWLRTRSSYLATACVFSSCC